jgi:hypothetical protein
MFADCQGRSRNRVAELRGSRSQKTSVVGGSTGPAPDCHIEISENTARAPRVAHSHGMSITCIAKNLISKSSSLSSVGIAAIALLGLQVLAVPSAPAAPAHLAPQAMSSSSVHGAAAAAGDCVVRRVGTIDASGVFKITAVAATTYCRTVGGSFVQRGISRQCALSSLGFGSLDCTWVTMSSKASSLKATIRLKKVGVPQTLWFSTRVAGKRLECRRTGKANLVFKSVVVTTSWEDCTNRDFVINLS